MNRIFPPPSVFPQAQAQRTLPMNLKLIIDKNTKQLLFAEANKDFVDFLFDIPSLPIIAFLNLSQRDEQNRTLAKGEGSLGTLYNTITNMETINRHITLTNSIHNASYDHVQPGKYMVMDDLIVEPMSTVALVKLLNKLGDYGSDVNKLEEIEVRVGKTEVARLLKESLVTNKVLSTVFLGEKNKDGEAANKRIEDYFEVGGQRIYHNTIVGQRPQGLFGNQTSSQPF